VFVTFSPGAISALLNYTVSAFPDIFGNRTIASHLGFSFTDFFGAIHLLGYYHQIAFSRLALQFLCVRNIFWLSCLEKIFSQDNASNVRRFESRNSLLFRVWEKWRILTTGTGRKPQNKTKM
jgi:hypothetical protein